MSSMTWSISSLIDDVTDLVVSGVKYVQEVASDIVDVVSLFVCGDWSTIEHHFDSWARKTSVRLSMWKYYPLCINMIVFLVPFSIGCIMPFSILSIILVFGSLYLVRSFDRAREYYSKR